MSLKFSLLSILLLSRLAGAQDRTYQVTFHAPYRGLHIYRMLPDTRQLEYVGLTGQALSLTLDDRKLDDTWLYTFGYESDPNQPQHASLRTPVKVRAGDLAGWGRYPQSGQIPLKLTSDEWARWLWHYHGNSILAAMVGASLAGVLAIASWKSKKRPGSLLPVEPQPGPPSTGLPWELSPGSSVHDYAILERLGEGATAVVYRVRQGSEEYALKLLKPGEIRGAEVAPRFRREMRVLTQLRHPHLPYLKDFGEHNGLLYLVMELLSPSNLGEVLRQRRPSSSETRQWLLELASALAVTHQKGVLHRDIKPDNAVFGTDGRLKLTDFGLARDQGATTVTAEGAWLGTPLYMAPELFQGARASTQSDQYALGILAYQLLTGTPPFQGESPLAVAVQHMQAEVPPLSLQPEWNEIIQRMLNKDPQQRFPSLDELLEQLRNLAGT